MAPPLLKWKVLSNRWITHDVFETRLARPVGFEGFAPGQYLSIVIPGAGPGGRNLRRAYSIASSPETPEIELCVKLVEGGPGTNYLVKLKEGEEIEAQAPFGHFVLDHDQNLPVLFIGTGTGIAPHRSMVMSKAWQPKAEVAFLLGVRDEKDILYPEMFPEFIGKGMKSHAAETNILHKWKHSRVCISRPSGPWTGFKGRVTDYMKTEMTDFDFGKAHYYLCGSGAMLTEVKDWLTAKGVTKEQIHFEKYY